MRLDIKTPQEAKNYIQKIENHLKQNNELYCTKFVKLGTKTVRLLCYSKAFMPIIKKQLSYVLSDKADKYDATLVVWNEKKTKEVSEAMLSHLGVHRIRLEKILSKQNYMDVWVFDESYSKHNPLFSVDANGGFINAYDKETNTYYYGVEDLNPEEFIKQGHIFVQMFNKIAKSENVGLVHGAVVGLDNSGVLFCARGQRGKSTLAVLAMMQGFEYVSDDYLILEKEGDELYSYPIYSIITLSPRMYNELYEDLKGKFISNNARRDKYVINIDAYHDTFKDKYPVKVCMFPEIVSDPKPSIVPCKKGRAITQLIHSTIRQTADAHDIKTINKLMGFVKDFEFYQINLCQDINANVECLRDFCNKLKK